MTNRLQFIYTYKYIVLNSHNNKFTFAMITINILIIK
jgi:hypothetical protein